MVRPQDDTEPGKLLLPWDDIDVVGILLTGVAAWLIVLGFTTGVRWLSQRLPTRVRFYLLPWPPIVRLFIALGAIALIVPMVLRPEREAMLALAGSGAVALGFAFKDYVSSLIAGVVMLFERPCSVGDWVRVGGVYGRVEALRLRVMRVVTPEDDVVSIPHSMMWNNPVINANAGDPDHLCVADFHVDPEHDPAIAYRVLEDVALTSAYRNLERPVTVIVNEEVGRTHYRIKAYPFDSEDQFIFITDLTLRGKRALAEVGARPARVPELADASAARWPRLRTADG